MYVFESRALHWFANEKSSSKADLIDSERLLEMEFLSAAKITWLSGDAPPTLAFSACRFFPLPSFLCGTPSTGPDA